MEFRRHHLHFMIPKLVFLFFFLIIFLMIEIFYNFFTKKIRLSCCYTSLSPVRREVVRIWMAIMKQTTLNPMIQIFLIIFYQFLQPFPTYTTVLKSCHITYL